MIREVLSFFFHEKVAYAVKHLWPILAYTWLKKIPSQASHRKERLIIFDAISHPRFVQFILLVNYPPSVYFSKVRP